MLKAKLTVLLCCAWRVVCLAMERETGLTFHWDDVVFCVAMFSLDVWAQGISIVCSPNLHCPGRRQHRSVLSGSGTRRVVFGYVFQAV